MNIQYFPSEKFFLFKFLVLLRIPIYFLNNKISVEIAKVNNRVLCFVRWTLLIVFLTYANFWGWEILSVCGGCLILITISAFTEDGTLRLRYPLSSQINCGHAKYYEFFTACKDLECDCSGSHWRPSTLQMGPSFPKQHHSWSLVLTLHIRCRRPRPSQYSMHLSSPKGFQMLSRVQREALCFERSQNDKIFKNILSFIKGLVIWWFEYWTLNWKFFTL